MKFKYLYNLKYQRKTLFKKKDLYSELPILKGNQDESIDWIDDITYDDLIKGNVDCIGDINEIFIH